MASFKTKTSLKLSINLNRVEHYLSPKPVLLQDITNAEERNSFVRTVYVLVGHYDASNASLFICPRQPNFSLDILFVTYP